MTLYYSYYLAKSGATILMEQLPEDVPGMGNLRGPRDDQGIRGVSSRPRVRDCRTTGGRGCDAHRGANAGAVGRAHGSRDEASGRGPFPLRQ